MILILQTLGLIALGVLLSTGLIALGAAVFVAFVDQELPE